MTTGSPPGPDSGQIVFCAVCPFAVRRLTVEPPENPIHGAAGWPGAERPNWIR